MLYNDNVRRTQGTQEKEMSNMAKIKNVRVQTIALTRCGMKYGYYWTWKTFTTFTDDNGNETYLIDGDRKVTKDEGNQEYLELKNSNLAWRKTKDAKDFFKRQRDDYNKCKRRGTADKYTFYLKEEDTFERTVDEEEVTYETLIERLENSIDRYVEYIDDGRQYEAAKRSNAEIERKIELLKKLIEERK